MKISLEFNTGLNQKSIELNFNDDKIIMFLGKNGSGKSTLMAAMHPYKESFDDRKNLIIEGEEGRKEIDIQVNDHLYEITHTYSKNPQSFIKKDGKELNENGGVRTFEDIVSKELGITKDYFNIGKIGSNARSFVDFTTSERKAYIGKFLNIEEILDKHKIVANKLKLLKKDILSVGSELGKYKDSNVIQTEIDQLSKSTDEINDELNVLYTKQGSLKTQIERDEKDIGTLNKKDLELKIQEKTNDSETNRKIKIELEAELEYKDTAEDYKKTLSEEIIEIQTKIQVNDTDKNNKNLLLTDYTNKLQATKIELSSLGNPEDIKVLEEQILKLSTDISDLKSKIIENPISSLINTGLKNKRDMVKDINRFVDFTDFIEKYFTNLSGNNISANRLNIEYFFDEDFEESFKRQIEMSKKAIKSKEDLLEKEQKDRGILDSYVCQLQNLEKRPHECTIDSCPFIKEAYSHRNVLSEIEGKDQEINQTKKDIESLNIKSENLQMLQNLYQNFINAYSNVSPRDNQIYVEFLREKSLIEWLKGSLSDFQLKRQFLISNANDAISDFNKYIELTHRLNNSIQSKKVLEDSDSTVKEKFEKDIIECEKKIEELNSEITVLMETGKILVTQLEEKQTLLEKYNLLIQTSSKYASASTMLSAAKSEYERISKLIDSKSQAEIELAEVINKIASLNHLKSIKSENLSKLSTQLARVQDLNDKKEILDKQYEPISIIEEALSPTKGIPLILMKTYLEETETIANELLDIAFNGDFQIRFVTTDKEFSIQVESKGNLKPDIKMASQGEVAITTISLSLALIEQSIGGYNILCLDEIDGPLDGENRTNFIDILNSQIDKLGIEQVFIISHNNAFDTAQMGLVLLKGNNIDKENTIFMENKNIIFEYEGV